MIGPFMDSYFVKFIGNRKTYINLALLGLNLIFIISNFYISELSNYENISKLIVISLLIITLTNILYLNTDATVKLNDE